MTACFPRTATDRDKYMGTHTSPRLLPSSSVSHVSQSISGNISIIQSRSTATPMQRPLAIEQSTRRDPERAPPREAGGTRMMGRMAYHFTVNTSASCSNGRTSVNELSHRGRAKSIALIHPTRTPVLHSAPVSRPRTHSSSCFIRPRLPAASCYHFTFTLRLHWK